MTSTIFSLYLFLAGVFAIIGGWAAGKYGPKRVVIAMGIISGLSLFLTSRVESAWQVYLAYSVLLSMGTGAMYIIVMSTGSRWFLQERATALGVIGAGAGLGIAILAPVSASLISDYGWRDAYLILGIVAWVLVIPLAFLLKRGPSDIGEQPDANIRDDITEQRYCEREDFPLKKALKTRNSWLFFLIWFSLSFCLHMIMTHVVPRAEDLGITLSQAAAILGVLAAFTIPSRLLTGFVADIADRKTIGLVFAFLLAIVMFWLVDADKRWMFYLFAVVYGLAYGGLVSPILALIGDNFGSGLERVGTVMGIMIMGWGLGSAGGPYFGGFIFDHTGHYQFAFFCGGLIMTFAAACIWGLQIPPGSTTEITGGDDERTGTDV